MLAAGATALYMLRLQNRKPTSVPSPTAEVHVVPSNPTVPAPAPPPVETVPEPVASVLAPPPPDAVKSPPEAKGRRPKAETARVEAATMTPAAAVPVAPPPQPMATEGPPAQPSPTPPAAVPPTAAPSPVPASPTPAAPTPAPAYDPASARVDIGAATNPVGATSSSFTRTVLEAGAQMTNCYRSALARTGGALEGHARLHVETDGAGVITDALLSGLPDATVARCVATAVRGRRIANVDTGSASADVPMVFRTH
jgi:hypothetical protein